MGELRVRGEEEADREAVLAVNECAFPTAAEAALVEALRGRTEPQVSLVAELPEQGVVGHILFTPVRFAKAASEVSALGLAPMAVVPARQRQGIGSALVRAGLGACRDAGAGLVVVLGHPAYYPRFGFTPAWEHGLYYQEPGPNPAFLVQALAAGALEGVSGAVHYHPAFDGL